MSQYCHRRGGSGSLRGPRSGERIHVDCKNLSFRRFIDSHISVESRQANIQRRNVNWNRIRFRESECFRAGLYVDYTDETISERRSCPLEGYFRPGHRGSSVEELALHVVDRGKARTLLVRTDAHLARDGSGQSRPLEERRTLAEEVSALVKIRGMAPRPGGRHQFEKETEQIEAKIARQREIESLLRKSGRAPLVEPDLLRPAGFQKTLRTDEACIEYAATENRFVQAAFTLRWRQTQARETWKGPLTCSYTVATLT